MLFAGHSLDVALATLCAFDIVAAMKLAGAVTVTVTISMTVNIAVTAIAEHYLLCVPVTVP